MEQMAVTIQNLENAANYSSKFYIFDENGGDIGSDSSATFRCQDANGSIHAKQARIGYEEGFFTYAHLRNNNHNTSTDEPLGLSYATAAEAGDTRRMAYDTCQS